MINDTELNRIVDYLDRSYFKEVWSSIRMESRINIKLTKTHARPQSGIILFKHSSLDLPDDSIYNVYAIPNSLTDRSFNNIEVNKWITGRDITINNYLNIFLYSEHGLVIPLNKCWFYVSNSSRNVLVVCDTQTMRYMDAVNDTIYITFFNDIDRETPLNIQEVVLPDRKNVLFERRLQEVQDLISKPYSDTNTIVYVNGINYLPSQIHIDDIPEKSVVEVREDLDVDKRFVTACDENDNGYYSDLYKGYREILHIPKELNPDNIVYTHNCLTVYVRDMDTNKGVYYHRVQPTTIRNITHNDFSLSRDVLNAHKSYLGATRIQVEVWIRTPNQVNHLINDRIGINALYQDTDDNIVNHLTGRLDQHLDFWKATNAEKSSYVMYMYTGFCESLHNKFDLYKSGFGAYSIAELLTSNHYLFKSYIGGKIQVKKPFILRDKTCKAFVFIDGKKLPEYRYNSINTDNSVFVDFIDVNYNDIKDSQIVIAVYQDKDYAYQEFHPTVDNLTFDTLLDPEYQIYLKQSLGDKDNNSILGFDYTSKYDLQSSNVATMNNNNVVFNKAYKDNTFFLVNTSFTKYQYIDITDMVNHNQSLIFSLDTWITHNDNTSTCVPILYAKGHKVFLNGNMLTPYIDYTVQDILSDDGLANIGSVLYVNNKNYLNLDNGAKNEIEIYSSRDQITTEDIGYQDHSYLAKQALPNLWYKGINWCTLEGKVITNIDVKTAYLKTNDDIGNGKVFYIYMDWLDILNELFKDYDYDADKRIQKYIAIYYQHQYPDTPPISFIPDQHEVYSTYISVIIDDMLSNKFYPVYDVSDTAFLQQFDDYEYLVEYDSTINENNYLNRLYVGVGGTYSEPTALTSDQTLIIRKLISLKLYPSKESIHTTYI